MKIVGKVDDLEVLLTLFPKRLYDTLQNHPQRNQLIEIVLDLGFPPEVRFSDNVFRLIDLGEVTQEDIHSVTHKIGQFNTDNRAGIERTLHRISGIRNRTGDIIGLTCRVGRAVVGTIDIIKDIVESGQNILFLGPPGIGKTTLLRETARVLSDESKKRVIVVDTSNEIAGDGNISHPGIGFARRMQVPSPDLQHTIMIEAVQNHMPEVIIVDEIGTEAETKAARTIAERGVQLVATAHGYTIENLINNPTLSNLLGGVQTVILGDEEAKFRGTKKTVLERQTSPTFDVLIEIHSRDHFVIYNPVASFVDALLLEDPLKAEHRRREGLLPTKIEPTDELETPVKTSSTADANNLAIFSFGVHGDKLLAAIHSMQVPVTLVNSIHEADTVLTTQAQTKSKTKLKQILQGKNIPVHVIKQNTDLQIKKYLRDTFHIADDIDNEEIEGLREIEKAIVKVKSESRIVEVSSRPTIIRRRQHQVAYEKGLNSMSVGEEPNRRVRIYPRST